MSLSFPASHCPGCSTPIPWFRNIPVVTWLLQRGRCAHCGFRIPVRYVLVEAISALVGLGWCALALAGWWQEPGAAAGWIVFALMGIPIALIDWDTFEIPDGIVVVAGVGGGAARTILSEAPVSTFLDVLRDGLLAAGLLYAISFSSRVGLGWLGRFARSILRATRPRRSGSSRTLLRILLRWGRFDGDVEALGLGDVSLGLAAGAALGFPSVLGGLAISAVLGLLGQVMSSSIRPRAKEAGLDSMSIPFGPFLVVGFLLASIVLSRDVSNPGRFSFFP